MVGGKPQLKEVKEEDLLWINITEPTYDTTKFLAKSYKFHHLDLEDCIAGSQRPKIDDYERYLFIILHFPFYDKRTKSIRVDEVNIFIGQHYLITLSPGNKMLANIFNKLKRSPKMRKKYMGTTSGYLLYEVIDEMFASFFPLIDNMIKRVDDLEEDVFEMENPRDMLKDILSIKKDIITLRRIIIPQRTLVPQLEHKNKKFLPEKLEVYFDDVVDKVEKIYGNMETLKEMVASLHETNESILTHNTNNIIKVLTIFSVVMLPLTFVTGVYGMNIVGLPAAQHPLAFLIVVGFMMTIVFGMLIFFFKKKWL